MLNFKEIVEVAVKKALLDEIYKLYGESRKALVNGEIEKAKIYDQYADKLAAEHFPDMYERFPKSPWE